MLRPRSVIKYDVISSLVSVQGEIYAVVGTVGAGKVGQLVLVKLCSLPSARNLYSSS